MRGDREGGREDEMKYVCIEKRVFLGFALEYASF